MAGPRLVRVVKDESALLGMDRTQEQWSAPAGLSGLHRQPSELKSIAYSLLPSVANVEN